MITTEIQGSKFETQPHGKWLIFFGAIHMALGGEVDNCARLVPGQQAGDEFTVSDATLHKAVPRVVLQAGQGFEAAGRGDPWSMNQRCGLPRFSLS